MSEEFDKFSAEVGLDKGMHERLKLVYEVSQKVMDELSKLQSNELGMNPFSAAMTVLGLATSFLIKVEASGHEDMAADTFDRQLRFLLQARKSDATNTHFNIH
jgi:hypothetical protein